jgi:hypothetical protein
MRGRVVISRDLYGGGIFVAIGLLVFLQGRTYNIGTLAHVGSGLFPVALGVVLMGLGALIAFGGIASSEPESEGESESVPPMQWKGFAAIVAGVLAFIVVGGLFGLAPAAFCCVFISALGDRTATLKSAAILGIVMTLFALLFFSYFLSVQFPVFQLPTSWGNP